MPKNTSAKGRRIEKLAREILEADGYEVESPRPRIVWLGPKRPISVSTDYYGRIDLIALHPTQPPLLIQTSVPSELSRKRKLLMGWTPAACVVEVWIWHGGRGRGFVIYSSNDGFAKGSSARKSPTLVRQEQRRTTGKKSNVATSPSSRSQRDDEEILSCQ